MDLIEQAVFTSAQTDRSAGYQVVAASPGVTETDIRRLSVWGPSHGALLESGPRAASVNFHPLSEETFCASRTTAAGWEYSGRGGARVYTHCLVLSTEILRRFANNPFAVLKAALASGALRPHEKPPKRMEPLRLAGRARAVDATLLARLRRNPGPEWMAAIVQAVRTSPAVALAAGPPAEQLIAGLINCLPPECRTEISFSTGLKSSSRRPFRLVALPDDAGEQRRVQRLYNLNVLRLDGDLPSEQRPTDSWAQLVERVLKSGRSSFLANHLADRRPDFSPQDLPALGLQLLEELDATALTADGPEAGSFVSEPPSSEAAGGNGFARRNNDPRSLPHHPAPPPGHQPDTPNSAGHERGLREAHAPHPRFDKGRLQTVMAQCKPDGPSRRLVNGDSVVLEKLERLDDLVFEAISGKQRSLDKLQAYWPTVRTELDEPMLGESRLQYIRYALSIWERLSDPAISGYSAPAIQALDVLCLLFDEVE